MTFWPLTDSDFPTNQSFHQFHDLDTDFDLHRITSGFHGALATGMACQQGTLTPPDTLSYPIWDLQMFFCWDHWQSIITPVYDTFPWLDFLPNLTLLLNIGFHKAFATGVACRQGTLTLPDTWFRPPFWNLLMLQLLRPNSSNLPCLYSTFHLEYPLVLSRFCLEYFFSYILDKCFHFEFSLSSCPSQLG